MDRQHRERAGADSREDRRTLGLAPRRLADREQRERPRRSQRAGLDRSHVVDAHRREAVQLGNLRDADRGLVEHTVHAGRSVDVGRHLGDEEAPAGHPRKVAPPGGEPPARNRPTPGIAPSMHYVRLPMHRRGSVVTRRTEITLVLVVSVVAAGLSGCSGPSSKAGPAGPRTAPTAAPGRPAPTPAQLAEARRLVDPDHEPVPPTAAQVACVAHVVVQDPNVDEIANDMAQIDNPDLRELVMTDYLLCAYDFVLDLYMRFAPAGLKAQQLACIRSKFTQLEIGRLAEVMVLDPDAGYTGPLVIAACKSGSKTNPLLHGTIPSMGGS